MNKVSFFLLFLCMAAGSLCMAQKKDSTAHLRMLGTDSVKKVSAGDTTVRKHHSPKKAAIYSAVLPGLGQAYNKKYWKIPIVYAALGITGSIFRYNLQEYHKVRFAYITLRDTVKADYSKVAPELQPFVNSGDLNSLRNYRDEFRKNIDYSVLFFLFFWGLNVVDATVDAHLKEFDVGNDLTLKIKPAINALPNTIGLSFVFNIGPHARPLKQLPVF